MQGTEIDASDGRTRYANQIRLVPPEGSLLRPDESLWFIQKEDGLDERASETCPFVVSSVVTF